MSKTPKLRSAFAALTALAALVTASPEAEAVDGVREINQAAALAGGVTTGDGAGFPVSINETGSYVLTSNLDVGNANSTAILVSAPDVSIDLNGFVIAGPGCPTTTNNPSCTFVAGSGFGIDSGALGTRIHNGTIRAFGSSGARLLGDGKHVVEDITFAKNGGNGIRVGLHSTIRDCTAADNVGNGFFTDDFAILTGNIASNNQDAGIRAANRLVATNNLVTQNTWGVVAGTGVVITGNTIASSTHDGVVTSTGLIGQELGSAVVSFNSVVFNGEEGVVCGTCAVTGNSIAHNWLGPFTGYELVTTNGGSAAGSQITGNTFRSDTGQVALFGNDGYAHNSFMGPNFPGSTQPVGGINEGGNFCNLNSGAGPCP